MTFHNFEGDEDNHDHDDAGEGEDEDVFASCEDAIMKIHISLITIFPPIPFIFRIYNFTEMIMAKCGENAIMCRIDVGPIGT